MSHNQFRTVQFNLSGVGFWIAIFLGVWLLGAIGLGWLVKSFLILIGLILIAPVIAFFWFRWWLKKNLVEDQCPVCGFNSVGINNTQLRCPSCGEALQIDKGHFHRLTPPGTVDVEAIEVSVKQIED